LDLGGGELEFKFEFEVDFGGAKIARDDMRRDVVIRIDLDV
jgi:hypothetical protein